MTTKNETKEWSETAEKRDIKEWTLMFYLASDNDLAPSVVSQLKSIKQAGFHQQVNVVVQFDPQSEGTPTHVFDVNLVKKLTAKRRREEHLKGGEGAEGRDAPDDSQIGFSGLSVNDPFIPNLIEDKLWRKEVDRSRESKIRDRLRESLFSKYGIDYNPPPPPAHTKIRERRNGRPAAGAAAAETRDGRESEKEDEVELSPGESLAAFLKFCAEFYPARRYILFILGHGVVVANDIFLFDENAEEQSLSLNGLGKLLDEFREQLNRSQVPEAELELISFHSCSVSSLEVAYQLEGKANYMLASQGPAFVGSWPYRQILISLFNLTTRLEARGGRDGERQEIDEAMRNITSYCFHNSTDFLLAGHSFDVTLCDLTRVSDHFTEQLARLKKALRGALGNSVTRSLVLLAHWEAQSEWQENYTDLHDFCFCLRKQCEAFTAQFSNGAVKQLSDTLSQIDELVSASNAVRVLLDSHGGWDGSGVIVQSEFAGPEHQYSHGLSVYFPWSRPTDDTQTLREYAEYTFNKKIGWLEFLEDYFATTQRESRATEVNLTTAAEGRRPRELSRDEELSEDLANLVFGSRIGQLNPEDALVAPAGKVNPNDRTGDCACATIKNYPHDTRDFRARQRAAPKPDKQGNFFTLLGNGTDLLR